MKTRKNTLSNIIILNIVIIMEFKSGVGTWNLLYLTGEEKNNLLVL